MILLVIAIAASATFAAFVEFEFLSKLLVPLDYDRLNPED